MKKKLKNILVCPACHGALRLNASRTEMICEKERIAYPVRNGIPVLLKSDARKLGDSE